MNIPRHILIMLIFPAFGLRAQSQAVQFAREDITVSVLDRRVTLDGVYAFRNHGPIATTRTIFYPLLHTSMLPFPDSIAVFDTLSKERVPWEKTRDGVMFPLEMPPGGTRGIYIRYSQQTPGRSFEYILTTTKTWGRPLEAAAFHIIVPDSLRLTSCSPSVDSHENRNGHAIFHIKRTNFMPGSNLTITWKRRTQ